MESKKTFGEYVNKRRKEMGFTQKEFAEKLFVTESAVSKWERGMSYPDITLIRDICDILKISEHELLTASEDVETRNSENLAKRYIRLVNSYRNILSILYGLSIVVCFICNITIQHTLSWFFVVLTGVIVATSLTLVPVYVTEKKGLTTIGLFTTSIGLLLLTVSIYSNGNWFLIAFVSFIFGMTLIFLPFILQEIWLPKFWANKKVLLYLICNTILLYILLMVCNNYTDGDWFLPIALPIASYSLVLPWGIFLIIKYAKVNGFFRAAGCFALSTSFAYGINFVLDAILGNNVYDYSFGYDLAVWNEKTINGNVNLIVLMALLFITVTFTIAGVIFEIRNKCNIEKN